MKIEDCSESAIAVQYVKQEPELILEDVKLEPEEYSVLMLSSDDEEEETVLQVPEKTKTSFSFSSSSTIKNESHLKDLASKKISFSDIGALSRSAFKTEKAFKCLVCPETFNSQRLLEFHQERAHVLVEAVTFNCEICEKTFKTEAEHTKHKLRHEKKIFFCGICKKTMSTKHSLDQHVRTVHKSQQCSHCPMMLSSFSQVKIHVNEVHGIDTSEVSCEVCQILFRNKIALENHEERNHVLDEDDITFACYHCQKTFVSRKALQIHKQLHSPPVRCTICDRVVKQRNLPNHMKQHSNRINPPSIKKFQCDLCPSKYAFKYQLCSHLKDKHRRKKFECKFCDQRYHYEQEYRKHLLRHIELAQRPLKCDLCPKTYVTKKNLTQHIETIHLGKVLKFPCWICKEPFDTTYLRDLHRNKVHTGVKKRAPRSTTCEICERTFTRLSGLFYHQKKSSERNGRCRKTQIELVLIKEEKFD